MTLEERFFCAINWKAGDHITLTTWRLGFQPSRYLRCKTTGREVIFRYIKRAEHIHAMSQTLSCASVQLTLIVAI
jgi:hypothetical protein